MDKILLKISLTVSRWGSSTVAFLLSIIVVLVWLAFGPVAGFSDTWLLTITVISDVIIFIMVFSIQNAQFRDSKAIQLKLNELIKSNQRARDTFIGLETLTDGELSALDQEFKYMLSQINTHPAMHKVHAAIQSEKSRRPTLLDQTNQFVDGLIHPHDKK